MHEIVIKHQDKNLQAVLHEAVKTPAKATIIISHGFRGSKEGGGRAKLLAEGAALEKCNVIRFDFTALSTLTEQINELNSVLCFAKEKFNEDIILLGRSMGGCASLFSCTQNKDVRGLILCSMPFDLYATFTLTLGIENLKALKKGYAVSLDDEWGKAILQPEFYADLMSYDMTIALTQLCESLPTLFVHGEFDEIVPLQQAEKAYELCASEKTFALIEGGDHRFISGFEQSKEAILRWLAVNF